MNNPKHIDYYVHQVHMVRIHGFLFKFIYLFFYLDKHEDETIISNQNGKFHSIVRI